MSLEELSIYFTPIDESFSIAEGSLGEEMNRFVTNFPEIQEKGIVFFDCPEFRNSSFQGESNRSKNVREMLYQLNFQKKWNFDCYDLGTISCGNTIKDTYFALKTVVAELVKKNCVPIILGGSEDLTFAIYQAYQQLEQTINIAGIDSKLDLGIPDEELNDRNYISHILTTRPCALFDYSIIGTQQPFLMLEDMELIDKLYFDACRLGDLMVDFKRAEPLIRNSDLLTFDLTALKSLTNNSKIYPNPNGIPSEVACQIARYAGISDRLSCLFIASYFEAESSVTLDSLVAQMIWYFMDGVANRYGDFPITTINEYKRFTVNLEELQEQIVFYKSNKSGRWWMEVPYPKKKEVKFERQTIVPCNMEDYERAMNNEIPDLWWKTFQKLL